MHFRCKIQLDHHPFLQEYEWGLAQYLGAGVAACYRGYRVYDTDRTESLVKKYVEFYKASHGAKKILNGETLPL